MESAAPHRYDARKDMPVTEYIAFELYGKTRKKELIDTSYKLGVSVSYDRLKSITTQVVNITCVFTTASANNIDHNLSSTTARGAFHGTAISLMQHAKEGHEGIVRTRSVRNQNKGQRLHIKLAAFRCAGQWLDGSGWVTALVEAEVPTQGRAESMINVSHIAKRSVWPLKKNSVLVNFLHISLHNFSTIALDHAHEQLNDRIKGDGGSIGLTQNSTALRK
ncbi:hypothetical protein PR048_032529 [Dryococelus australis]|uniref:Uncharacterized protein n=1 Tax=Dryococelus australis TaxID=614101 RepID=A0ABQ9G5L7_9NEOP|nr:hypothetical protein PR048_032529 [Dryococelus australis]